ncbi:MAG: hypothetical protein QM536_09510 [Chitinophagaceae bacterium]|nr:hypothetical protein [Chitinophagaceae bacterium]
MLKSIFLMSQSFRFLILWIELKKVTCLIGMLYMITFYIHAQNMDEVIYAKNGSIIRGVIVEEIPQKTLKIKTKDGSIFVVNFLDIDKITKEESTSKPHLFMNEVVHSKNGSIMKGIIVEKIPQKTLKIKSNDGSIFVVNFSDVDKITKENTTKTHLVMDEVIYSKNGSIMKGVIVEEIPQKTLKVKANDGSIFVVNFLDIEKITKEERVVSQPVANTHSNDVPNNESNEKKTSTALTSENLIGNKNAISVYSFGIFIPGSANFLAYERRINAKSAVSIGIGLSSWTYTTRLSSSFGSFDQPQAGFSFGASVEYRYYLHQITKDWYLKQRNVGKIIKAWYIGGTCILSKLVGKEIFMPTLGVIGGYRIIFPTKKVFLGNMNLDLGFGLGYRIAQEQDLVNVGISTTKNIMPIVNIGIGYSF